MAARDKILVVGSNAGSVSGLLAKAAGINAKHGPFSAVVCCGDLFPAAKEGQDDQDVTALLDGQLKVTAPTYFMLGERALPAAIKDKVDSNAGEVCENLTFLGKQTVFTLASGLKIGVCGGAYIPEHFNEQTSSPDSAYLSAASLTAFASQDSAANLDILLTHAAPSGILRGSDKPLSESISRQHFEQNATPALHHVLQHCRPKYHFAAAHNVFWEREPYTYAPAVNGSNGSTASTSRATRFLSLGYFGNTTKQRWFYAFSVTPSSSEAHQDIPPNATPYPFITEENGQTRGTKRSIAESESATNAFDDMDTAPNYIFGGANGDRRARGKGRDFGHDKGQRRPPPDTYTCRLCNTPGHWIQDCPEAGQADQDRPRRTNGSQKEIAPEECWFCLSNPNVTKHLIASIGSETYLTLPKGQVWDPEDPSTPVPGGGHCLIIPIAHYPTLSQVPGDLSAPIYAEIDAYKRALRSCYDKYGCQPLAMEVSRTGVGKAGHAHVQILPVPRRLATGAEALFIAEGAKAGYTLVSDTNEHMQEEIAKTLVEGNYLRVDLPDGSKLVHRIRPADRFSLQFGRQTAALLLGVPARADWKACARPDDEEAKDCQSFKAAFKEWDPSG